MYLYVSRTVRSCLKCPKATCSLTVFYYKYSIQLSLAAEEI